MRHLKTAIFLLALTSLSPVARAEDGPTPADIAKAKAATVSAHGLVDMFAQTCVAYAGNNARLKIWLDAHMTQANEAQSAYFLAGMQGKVWLQRSKIGNYAVVISDALGLCNAKVEKGPVSDVAAYLKENAPALKLDIKQTSDSPDGSFLGMTGRVITYGLQKKGEEYVISLVGRDTGGTPIQSQLSLLAKAKDS